MNEVNSKSNIKRIAIQKAGRLEDDVKELRNFPVADIGDSRAKVNRVLDRLERYEKALQSFVSMDRTRGYPTGTEWKALTTIAREALEEK